MTVIAVYRLLNVIFQILPVLSKVKNNMHEMVSFSPEDVIFLLNKWDTISHEDDDQLEKFIEETKECLHQWWREVDDSCIFRVSASKVLLYYRLKTNMCATKNIPNTLHLSNQNSIKFPVFGLTAHGAFGLVPSS